MDAHPGYIIARTDVISDVTERFLVSGHQALSRHISAAKVFKTHKAASNALNRLRTKSWGSYQIFDAPMSSI